VSLATFGVKRFNGRLMGHESSAEKLSRMKVVLVPYVARRNRILPCLTRTLGQRTCL
jgi:hypothetical protein